jgi:hypothetical protein
MDKHVHCIDASERIKFLFGLSYDPREQFVKPAFVNQVLPRFLVVVESFVAFAAHEYEVPFVVPAFVSPEFGAVHDVVDFERYRSSGVAPAFLAVDVPLMGAHPVYGGFPERVHVGLVLV